MDIDHPSSEREGPTAAPNRRGRRPGRPGRPAALPDGVEEARKHSWLGLSATQLVGRIPVSVFALADVLTEGYWVEPDSWQAAAAGSGDS